MEMEMRMMEIALLESSKKRKKKTPENIREK